MATLTQSPLDVNADSDLTLHMTRIIQAERSRVYAAWTQPERMRAWFGPGKLRVPTITNDLRQGGQYRVEMIGTITGELPDDGTEPVMFAQGTYLEVIPDERLRFTWNGSWSPNEETLVTVTFRDVPAGTEVVVIHQRFASKQSRDGHHAGWNSTLDKLAVLLAA